MPYNVMEPNVKHLSKYQSKYEQQIDFNTAISKPRHNAFSCPNSEVKQWLKNKNYTFISLKVLSPNDLVPFFLNIDLRKFNSQRNSGLSPPLHG